MVKKIKQLSVLILFFSGAFALAATDSLMSFDRFYIAGSPSEKTLADFKKSTGATVIDLRSIKELGNCSEPATASKLGLQYRKVNFEKAEQIDPAVIADVDKLVNEAGTKSVLLFCKTGNRAAAWLAIHLVNKQKMSVDEAVVVARGVGLKDDGERGVRDYFKSSEKRTSAR